MSNNGPEFFQTEMGKIFYNATMPSLASSVKKIADALNNDEEMISPAAKRAILTAYESNHKTLDKMKWAFKPDNFTAKDPSGSYEEGFENALKFVLGTLGIEIPEEKK